MSKNCIKNAPHACCPAARPRGRRSYLHVLPVLVEEHLPPLLMFRLAGTLQGSAEGTHDASHESLHASEGLDGLVHVQ